MRRLLIASALLLALSPGSAPALTRSGEVVVCDIDTGINPAHQEFAADQLTAFFDFSDESEPAAGQLWDPDTAPFDPNGHGTATAAMIGALGVSSEQSPSGFPGVKLAMAKVADDDGSITGDLATAIRWCVDTVRADAINMSIGVIVPVGPAQALFQDTFDAMHHARSQGVLFTSSNGNGVANSGVVPGDGASTPYGSSLDTLAVGAAGPQGLLVAYNPEVAAVYSVRAPTPQGRSTYRNTAGTSFASPFTNGIGARLIHEALDAGRTPTVADIEQTIKNVALDTALPPSQEGYGVIDRTRLPDAITAVRAGMVPARNDPSSLYVEEVAGAIRKLSNGHAPTDDYDDPGDEAEVGQPGQPAPAPTPTATATATATATVAPSATATASPTPTATATAAPSATASPAPTPGATVEPSPVPTVTTPGPVAPSLRVVRVLRKPSAQLRLMLDQRVTLTVVLTRAGKRVLRRVLRFRGPGAVTVGLGDLRRGRYRVRVRAMSELGAGSVTATKAFRVR